MQEFKLNDTEVALFMTLTEKVTLSSPNYLFVFTHTVTQDQVKFIRLNTADESLYQGRYNKFTINPSVLFSGKQPGFWNYKVYEQESEVNEDPEDAGEILETGMLRLNRAEEFEFTNYNSSTTFKTYNG